MAINLQKGQKIDLTKGNEGLNNILVGLGWDTNKFDGTGDFDLDASVFLVGENGKCSSDADLIFYNNLTGGNGSVEHTGDNLTGEGEGDDEQVKVKLSAVPGSIHKIIFTITINEAQGRNQNFGQVSNAFLRVVDNDKNEEIVRFDLGEDFSIETSVVAGELYRHNNEWKFNAIGMGYQGGLEVLCREYGLSV